MSASESERAALVVQRVDPDSDIPLPSRATAGSAGIDFTLPVDQVVWPGQVMVVRSGFRVRVPAGMAGVMFSRSSARVRGIEVSAVIDSDYRGEVGISLLNVGRERQYLKRGERLAQMVLVDVHLLPVVEGEVQVDTTRGESGFGSTGG